MSLYDDLGGAAAVTAALDQFYPKILADLRMYVITFRKPSATPLS